MSFALTGPNASASSIAASPCASGIPYLRMMISVSTPFSLMSPSTSTTLPTGPRDGVGHVVISTTTISPGSADRRLAGRHVHVRHNAAIERLHEAETGFRDIEAADDRGIAALEDADDPALEPVLGRPALDAREHAIAVHRLLDVGGRHVHVGRVAAGLVGNHEAEAGRVRLEAADDEVHLVGQPDAPALGLARARPS